MLLAYQGFEQGVATFYDLPGTKLPVRFWTVVRYPKYLIVYDPADKPLKVIRVFQGGRDFARELKNEP